MISLKAEIESICKEFIPHNVFYCIPDLVNAIEEAIFRGMDREREKSKEAQCHEPKNHDR